MSIIVLAVVLFTSACGGNGVDNGTDDSTIETTDDGTTGGDDSSTDEDGDDDGYTRFDIKFLQQEEELMIILDIF